MNYTNLYRKVDQLNELNEISNDFLELTDEDREFLEMINLEERQFLNQERYQREKNANNNR